jgi:hypothetical protein
MNQRTDLEEFNRLKKQIEKSKSIYSKTPEIWCPYFSLKITLNSDGFNHLLYKPNRRPRNMSEQLLKLRLLNRALEVIRKSGTLQEYRDEVESVGLPAKDGFRKTLRVQYWAFHAILGVEKKIKIVVVLRKAGDGKLTFWSVLPHKKFNNQCLYTEGIENE